MAIDLTALDVRSKRGDFSRRFRGYDRDEVDSFMKSVADRLEELTRAHRELQRENESMRKQLDVGVEREESIKDAVVSAQKFGKEMIDAAQNRVELMERDAAERAERIEENARATARRIRSVALEEAERARTAIEDLCYQRTRLLRTMNRFMNEGANLIAEEERREIGPQFSEGRIAAIIDGGDPDGGSGRRGAEANDRESDFRP